MRKNKYKNKKNEVDGHLFDSKVEAEYYLYLKRNIKVKNIVLQPKYILIPGFVNRDGKRVRPIYYIADFEITYSDGNKEVVDVKGFPTEVAKLKRKIFESKYQDIPLRWICEKPKKYRVNQFDAWIEYDELVKLRKQNKSRSKGA